jgi:hypothetical protein
MNLFDINLLFEQLKEEQSLIDEFNKQLHTLDERKRRICKIRPTDSANKIRKKCKVARVWGIHYAPVWDRYVGNQSGTDTSSTDVSGNGDSASANGGMAAETAFLYPSSIGSEYDTKTINDEITYLSPNAELEWNEAVRYPELKSLGKSKWEDLLNKGKVIPWEFLSDVKNYEEDLEQIDRDKLQRVMDIIKTGQVELPIVGRWDDGSTEVISGATRIALLNTLGFEPMVLVIPMPTKKTTRRKSVQTKPVQKKSKPKEKPKSSTERVRRYYKRHPEKVRKYLRDTQEDRVKRNGDRAKAVKKYGKKKMKNHDVHHPNGVNGGSWRLARKDHGRDKKNESLEYVYLSELIQGLVPNGPWQLISEGGAAGHLAHPYEDNELTFKDVKEMVKRGLVGGLDTEDAVTEKLDGQNIMFTVKDGQVLFARNKGQIKNNGKNALDVAGIRNMFAGRGNVQTAFTTAAEDLQNAVNSLPPEQQKEMFKNGGKFMNVEIIFPDTRNVIPYDKSVLVFHGTVDYDLEGNEVGRNIQDGKRLSDELIKVNAQQQATFGLSGPRSISFSDADTASNLKKMKEYGKTISRVQKEFKLDDKATIEDYKLSWWAREVDNMGVDWSDKEREGLIRRWALGDKKFGVKNIEDPERKKLFREYEANELSRAQKTATKPLERLFLRVGADTLLRVTNFLSANNPQLTAGLKKEVLDAIKQVQETGDINKIAKLQIQIERLEDIGINNIVPSEGIVFMYNGKPYKFTGTFAPVNQILGTLRFAKGKAEEIGQDEPSEPESTETKEPPSTQSPTTEPEQDISQEQKTIAIFPGRFQPFHAGHYSIYRALVKKFGEDNVYIGSSNKIDPITSPFSFNEKKEIMTKMFGIPEEKIVQVKNPYQPTEILKNYPENTVYVTAVSQKDAERLGGKYYKSYEDTPSEERKGYAENGYVVIAPEMQLQIDGQNISGTQIRSVMGNPNITDRAKQEIFTKIYGKFDNKLFSKIVKTATQSEEAKALTAAHGGEETRARARMKKQPEQQPPSQTPPPQQQAQQPTQQSVQQPTQQPTQQPAQQPQQEPQKQVEPQPETEPQQGYQPGEVWQTPSGLFGAKNVSTQETRYFRTQQSADIYSQS